MYENNIVIRNNNLTVFKKIKIYIFKSEIITNLVGKKSEKVDTPLVLMSIKIVFVIILILILMLMYIKS